MKYDLADIKGVPEFSQGLYQVKALCWEGGSLVLDALNAWKGTRDHKKMIIGLRMMGNTPKAQMAETARVREDHKRRGIYELKALRLNARLMFFYDMIPAPRVIVTNDYWKAGSSKIERKQQEEAFDDAYELMKEFQEERKNA